MNFRKALVLPAAALLAIVPSAARKKKADAPAVSTALPMAAGQRALHALNRLTFGPRPGDLEHVRQLGVDRWIEQQLYPESLPGSAVLTARLAPCDTLELDPPTLAARYPPNPVIHAMVEGRTPWPADPETRRMIQRSAGTGQPPATPQELARLQLPPAQQQILATGTPPEKVALLVSLPAETQWDVLTALSEGDRRKLFPAAPAPLRRTIQKLHGPRAVVNQDLFTGKLLRAVYSARQLEEVLTDFWFNHFNVYLDKGGDRYYVTSYERDVIRPHVLGRFHDLLLATAESPAMLFYLDNFQSVAPETSGKRGLNENYARELLELHTLGVDGGYTQQDVTEIARCFTGWSLRDPRRGGGFEFRERAHDQGVKHLLGVTLPPGGGRNDGLKVLEILAKHPSTARFISRALATRFVSDNPPDSLVERMAATFSRTDGDLREVLRTLFHSPEFWAAATYRAKLKTPLELVVSALRATDADVDYTPALAQRLNTLGEPLYRKAEPTGYSNRGADWLSSAALLARMNFALALAANKVPGVNVAPPPTADPAAIARRLLLTDLSPEARAVIENGLAAEQARPNAPPAPVLIVGLTLGSPDFQRR